MSKYDKVKSIIYGKMIDKTIDKDYSEISEELFGKQLASDECRKRCYGAKMVIDAIEQDRRDSVQLNADTLTAMEEKEIAIREERVRLSDVRRKYQKLIRESARSKANLEVISKSILELNEYKPFVYKQQPDCDGFDNEGVLVISDTHIGLKVDNYFNQYSVDIAKERLEVLVSQTIEKCKLHQVGKLHVLLLGDLISGAIHKDLVAESDVSLVDSVTIGSEMIANAIHVLSTQIKAIEVYFAIGNHSRIHPNKMENLPKDNFEYLMFDFIRLRLKDVLNIKFNNNTYHDEIIDFEVFGKKIVAMHGDKDKPMTVAKSMTQFLDVKPIKIYLGHYHHYESIDCNGTIVTVNGSLISTDTYALGLRLNSQPYQVLTIFNKANQDEECEYRLKVK